MKRALLLACMSVAASAGQMLGPALQLSGEDVQAHTKAARAAADGLVAGFSVDTSNRNAVLSLYHRVYMASESFDLTHGFDGDVGLCLPGTSSNDLKEDTRRRVNFYRAMVGLNANVTFDAEKSRKAQEAALIMSRQNGLSHFPNQDFAGNPCLTDDGHEAAGSSNLSLGNYGPNAVRGQITDDGSNNGAAGHRRWILYSRAQEMGTGDIPDGGGRRASNSLWVIGNFTSAPVPAPEIAWPPAGFVPYDLVPNEALSFPRWSYGYPGADFSQATVTMKQGDTPLSLVQEPLRANIGDNTLVWRPSGIPSTAPEQDSSYTVTITGIGNAPFAERTYTVTLIDPFALNEELVLSGAASAPAGLESTYSFDPVAAAEGYEANIASYTDQVWTEGAEPGLRIIDGTAGTYSLVDNHSVASGTQAFHLATPDFGSAEHVVIDRALLLQAGSQIQFKYRRLFIHPDTKLRVQLSNDSGQSFSTIHSIDGNNFGSSAQWDPATFLSATVDVPDSFHGRHCMLRFLLDNTGIAFIGVDAAVGIYIDDITLTNGLEITDQTRLSLDANATDFPYTPASEGEQRLLMAGVNLGGRFWGYGPALAVESVSALQLLSLLPLAGAGDVSADTNLVITFAEAVIKGSGTIRVRRVSDGLEIGSIAVDSGDVTVAGSVVSIDLPFALPHSTELEVDLAAGAFATGAGATFAGLAADGPWRFSTSAPAVPATILSLSPADDANDAPAYGRLILSVTFDKPMRKGHGALSVFNSSNNSLFASIDLQSSGVAVSGQTATITGPTPFTIDTDYYATFPAGAFVDSDGLDAPGISDPTGWNFHVSTLGFQLPLERGWNLISLPILPASDTIELLGGSGKVFAVQDGLIIQTTALQPKQAYFVFNPRGVRSVSLLGQAIGDDQTHLETGWNLIGVVAEPPYLPRTFSSSLTPDALPGPAWRLEGGGYRLSQVLEAGVGYWIYRRAE